MKYCRSLSLLVIFAVALGACGKMDMATPDMPPVVPPEEPGQASTGIEGTWSFVGIGLKATTIAIVDNSTTYNYNDYQTLDNSGEIAIDATSFKTTDLGYSIDTKFRSDVYLDDIFLTSTEVPFKFQLPPYSASSPYKLIGKDSIYFEKGFIDIGKDGTGASTDPSGGKISWISDTLVITSKLSNVTVSDIGGFKSTVQADAVSVMKMVRKK